MKTLTPPAPVSFGPTWETDETGAFVLPAISLGWHVIGWAERNLLNDEGEPWRFTEEQKRFVLWWYAVREDGRWLYRKGTLQRIKGWGKDPVSAVLCAVEFVGPCRVMRDGDGDPVYASPAQAAALGVPEGHRAVIGRRHPRAWVQLAAVSRDQTKNSMSYFAGLFSKECIAEHGIDLGKQVIYAHAGQCRLESVGTSPATMEGNRPTFVSQNETHHWRANNDGIEMASVIRRNLAKANDGSARSLSITNAYKPSEISVGRSEREAWEKQRDGLSINTGLFYDSLEASPGAYITLPRDDDGELPSEEQVREYIGAVIAAVRGDASWINVENIVNEILDPSSIVSNSRRFYYNQIVAAEDDWLDARAVDAAIDPLAQQLRGELQPNTEDSITRLTWQLVRSDEPIVMFFDGSKSDDSTGLVGCRISDGFTFVIGEWHAPPKARGMESWTAPRGAVSARVREAFKRFNIVAFFGDPSHAKDDEDSSPYWDALLDDWHREFKDRLHVWAVQGGDHQHSIRWDMASPTRTALFVGAAELYVEQMEQRNAETNNYAPAFRHDGHPTLMQHHKQAKSHPDSRYGVGLRKEAPDSPRKIDLAVCAVGAQMLRRLYVNKDPDAKKAAKAGEVWGW